MLVIGLAALNEEQNFSKIFNNFTKELLIFNKAYEDETQLKENYQKISSLVNFVVCIDGSSDNSLIELNKLAQIYPIIILPIDNNNKGLGKAFLRIFQYFLTNYQKSDFLLTLDADLTHQSSDLAKFLQIANDRSPDLIIGSRFTNYSKITGFPLYRNLISLAVAKTLQIIIKILQKVKTNQQALNYNISKRQYCKKQHITDFTSGFRLYNFSKLQELSQVATEQKKPMLQEANFTYTIEILLQLIRLDANIFEVAIDYNYQLKKGASKLNLSKNCLALFCLILQLLKAKQKYR